MKKVAVIILNWNGAALLRRYLPSVLENTNEALADIIVADNGSNDESRDVLAHEFPQVKTLFFEQNYGFAEGYNRAIKETGYPITILLNSDVRTLAGWLEPLVEALDDEGVGAAQPKLLKDRDDDRRAFEYAGAMGGFLDKHGYPYCRGRVFDSLEDDHGQFDAEGITPVFWASGACLAVRTEAFLSVGGLDASFFAHMEEIDLCWRLQLAGLRVIVVPGSEVFHLGGGSLPQGNARKTYLNFRNNLLMLRKNLPQKEGRRLLIVRRLLDALAIAQTLLKGHWGDVKAIVKAHRDYRKMSRQYTTFPERNLLHATPQGRLSIVWNYYARHRKTYHQIFPPSTITSHGPETSQENQ